MRTALCLLAASACTTIDDGYVLEIRASDAPLVVVKDGDGPWQRYSTTPDGTAFVQIYESSYGVGVLCEDDLLKQASFLFDTQPRTVFFGCSQSTPITETFHVRGVTEPMATVWLDSNSVRADATGRFDLTLFQQGLHDLVAILPTMPPKIVAQRGLLISGDTIVDLPATSAVEMTAVYPRVVATTEVEVSSDLNTGTDWVSFGSHGSTAYVPPSSFLLPTDRPAIAASAGGCTRQRPLAEANEPFDIPAPLDISVDRSQIGWSADPAIAWDSALLDITSLAGDTHYRAFSSASWREITQSTTIPIVDLQALPGWSAALPRLAPDLATSLYFSVSRGEFDGDLTSCGANEEFDHW